MTKDGRGKFKGFRDAWLLKERPQGLLRVYLLRGLEDKHETLGASLWESRAAIAACRRGASERARRDAAGGLRNPAG